MTLKKLLRRRVNKASSSGHLSGGQQSSVRIYSAGDAGGDTICRMMISLSSALAA